MHAVGLIAEFNPLHDGHVYAINLARAETQADVVVVVMSGNFVQRGEPAIIDKWARTRLALQAGADLVVELPVSDVVQAGSQFAMGAIAQLASLHVMTLAFGTEHPELDYMALARRMEVVTGERRTEFHDYTKTYASQLATAMAGRDGHQLTAPNQMLGVSYATANLEYGTPMTLHPFARQGAAHDTRTLVTGMTNGAASASLVRQRLFNHQEIRGMVPATTALMVAEQKLMGWMDLWPFLQYRLQTAGLDELQSIDQMGEGLEHRLRAAATSAHNITDFLHAAKSKRYTYARLRRLALATTLNLRADEVRNARTHRVTHILGFSSAGRAYLKQVKKDVRLPLVSRVSTDMLSPGGVMALDGRADALIRTITGREQNFGRVPIMEE